MLRQDPASKHCSVLESGSDFQFILNLLVWAAPKVREGNNREQAALACQPVFPNGVKYSQVSTGAFTTKG